MPNDYQRLLISVSDFRNSSKSGTSCVTVFLWRCPMPGPGKRGLVSTVGARILTPIDRTAKKALTKWELGRGGWSLLNRGYWAAYLAVVVRAEPEISRFARDDREGSG